MLFARVYFFTFFGRVVNSNSYELCVMILVFSVLFVCCIVLFVVYDDVFVLNLCMYLMKCFVFVRFARL